MMKNKNDFPTILQDYFSKYLMYERKFSQNTYMTYLEVLKQFIHFLSTEEKIKINNLLLNDFSKNNILKFLKYIEETKKCSVRTRNHKLSIINSFLEYSTSLNPSYLNIYLEAKSIKFKKATIKKMDYLTIDELKSFFSVIDLKHKNGYKHYVLLSTLYDTATRVTELINIKIDDIYFYTSGSFIKILGKGGKERLVYISDKTVNMIKEYINNFNIKNGYLFLNHSNKQLTRSGINKIISKYTEKTKKECHTMCKKIISPHTFRHSKAVHLLQNGTALPIIQRFLGHSNIQTTEIYLDITNDTIIKAINDSAIILSENKNQKEIWKGDSELMKLLESMK